VKPKTQKQLAMQDVASDESEDASGSSSAKKHHDATKEVINHGLELNELMPQRQLTMALAQPESRVAIAENELKVREMQQRHHAPRHILHDQRESRQYSQHSPYSFLPDRFSTSDSPSNHQPAFPSTPNLEQDSSFLSPVPSQYRHNGHCHSNPGSPYIYNNRPNTPAAYSVNYNTPPQGYPHMQGYPGMRFSDRTSLHPTQYPDNSQSPFEFQPVQSSYPVPGNPYL
jgi:hypothetical protein